MSNSNHIEIPEMKFEYTSANMNLTPHYSDWAFFSVRATRTRRAQAGETDTGNTGTLQSRAANPCFSRDSGPGDSGRAQPVLTPCENEESYHTIQIIVLHRVGDSFYNPVVASRLLLCMKGCV